MYEKKLFMIYILGILSIPVIVLWLSLLFNYSKKKLLTLSIITVLIITIYGVYLKTKHDILTHLDAYIEKPIKLKSYYGKENTVLFMHSDFKYTITYEQTLIKSGKWDVHAPNYEPIMIDGQILGLNELQISQ